MLSVTVNHADQRTELRFSGEIDHFGANAFADAFATLRKTVCINFKNVRYISSYGVGLMLRQMAAISREHHVEFAECTELMVDQFQMLQFSRYGKITSFQARFACAACGRTELRLLDVKRDLEIDVAAREVRARPIPCTCGSELVVDDSLEFVLEYI